MKALLRPGAYMCKFGAVGLCKDTFPTKEKKRVHETLANVHSGMNLMQFVYFLPPSYI